MCDDPGTYRDGQAVLRCGGCGRPYRDAAEGPLLDVRRDDIEALVLMLRAQGLGATALVKRLAAGLAKGTV